MAELGTDVFYDAARLSKAVSGGSARVADS